MDALPSVAQLNEDIARGLKKDGLTSAVVLRKMIAQHQVPASEAQAIVAKVFGAAPARGGSMVGTGVALVAAGLGGGALVFFSLGFEPMRLAVPLYVLAFGAFSSGLIALARSVTND